MGGFIFGEASAAPMQVASVDTIAGSASPPPPVAAEPPALIPKRMDMLAQPASPPPPPMPPPPPVGTKVAAGPTLVSTPNQSAASAFDEKFRGTPLEGKWDVVRANAEKNGISPSLAAAVMGQETGFGKNVRGNNPGGIMDPKTNWQKKMQFESIDDGISATTRIIARNYQAGGGTIEGLASRYAPIGAANDKYGQNKDWLPGVKKNIAFFDSPSF